MAIAVKTIEATFWEPWTDLGTLTFTETGSDGLQRSWIMMMPEGIWHHPEYGKLKFTRTALAEFKRKFDDGVRGIAIALDRDHKEGEAPGWIEQLELREAQAGHPAGLYALIKWTNLGVQLLKDQLYRYFSPEFGTHFDERTGKKIPNVILGGGLTNRPFLKSMPALALAERRALAEGVSHKSWASVNKSKLPRACFLIQGSPDDKSTWKLPIYEGAGDLDADGHYTKRGPLNINAVRAALAAIGGARTGTPMSGGAQGLRGRLQRLLQRYGGGSGDGGDGKSTAASESAAVRGRQGRHMPKSAESQILDEFDDQDDGDEEDEDEEDEGQSGAAYRFAQSTTPIKSPTDSTDVGDLYAEFDDGGDGGDGGDGAGYSKMSDTHGAMTCAAHSHGKYAEHSHDGDGDHSDAPLKAGVKSMREKNANGPRTLAEFRQAWKRQEAEMQQLRERNYRQDVKTLSERLVASVKLPEGYEGHYGMSKRFREAFESFMLDEGRRLSEDGRKAFQKLLITAYKYGPVATGTFALAEPPENQEPPVYGIDRGAEPTHRSQRLGGGGSSSSEVLRFNDGGGVITQDDGARVVRLAEQMAQQRHKASLKALATTPSGAPNQSVADTLLAEAAERVHYEGAVQRVEHGRR